MCDMEDDGAMEAFTSVLFRDLAEDNTVAGCASVATYSGRDALQPNPSSAGSCMAAGNVQPYTGITVYSSMQNSDVHCTSLDTHLILCGSPALEYEYMDDGNCNSMQYTMNPHDYFVVQAPSEEEEEEGEEEENNTGYDVRPDQDPQQHLEDYEEYEEYEYQEQGGQGEVLNLQGQVQDLEQQLHECNNARVSEQQQNAALTEEVTQLRAALAHREAAVQRVAALEMTVEKLRAIVEWKEREVVSSAKQLIQAKVQLAEVNSDKQMLQQQLVRELTYKQKSINSGSAAPSTAPATPSTGLVCLSRAPAGALPPSPSCSLLARASSQLAGTVAPTTSTHMRAAPTTNTRMRAAPKAPPTPRTVAPSSNLAGKASAPIDTFPAASGLAYMGTGTAPSFPAAWSTVLMGIVAAESGRDMSRGAVGPSISATGTGPCGVSVVPMRSAVPCPSTPPAGEGSVFGRSHMAWA